MTPDEQRLIEDLFDRLGNHGRVAKDRGAEALIVQSLRHNPDAAYMLVQSAIVYEHQLAENQARIRDLETELGGTDASSNDSFLGGRLGSVPAAGTRIGQPTRNAAQVPSSPWASARAAAQSGDVQPPVQSGGFLRSALSTVAGVAGGIFVADSLRDMFGGGTAHAAGSPAPATRAADQDAALKDADQTQDELQDQLLDDDAAIDNSDDGGEIDV